MRRRRTTSLKPTKARHYMMKAKRNTALKAGRRANSSVADLKEQIERQARELDEARERETAAAEVLRVISSFPGDLKPVFEAIISNAQRICGARFGNLVLFDGKNMRVVAMHNAAPEHMAMRQRDPIVPLEKSILGPLVRTKMLVHVADITAEEPYTSSALARVGGMRTALAVPMLRDDELVGAIGIYNNEVRPFTDKQIALLTNFAAQAVIAIENTRLLNELRQRTDDLSEALEQQTTTADILTVISNSLDDTQPVFEAIVQSGLKLFADATIQVSLADGDKIRLAAVADRDPARADAMRRIFPIPLTREYMNGVAILDGRVVDVPDAENAPPELAIGARNFLATGNRAVTVMPMMRGQMPIGALQVVRLIPGPLSDKQREVLRTFANQAVIAIENTRLLNELRQRTDDLTELLEQQTATSKVLEVISRSAFDLNAVFETLAESSVRLCGADRAFIFRHDGELLRGVAAFNASRELKEFVERNPLRLGRHSGAARAALERRTIHIPDVLTDPEYSYGAKDVDPVRTVLGVPILKGEDLMGVMMIYHLEVRPFTEKQIALVETFADQAAIAIENVRLLDELRERTGELGRSVGELRALGEVSQAVNSTLDLETVLSTIVAKAVQLSGTEAGAIYVFDELQREFHLRATYGMDRELIDALTQRHIGLDDPNVASVLLEHEPVQVADLKNEVSSDINEITLRAGYRARLVAPLIRGDDVVGLLVVRRRMPGEFAQNTIDLLKTFAAQSVLAIQNARLFDSVETRTRELAKSLEDLRTAQDRLVQTQKLASLGQLTAGIAHEIKNPLNFVNNFSGVSVELIDELQESLGRVKADDKTRIEITELTDTLRGNLHKVVQHGKRADAIVKNMLLHSRQGSGEHRPVDINALVEESLNLAYHGARAEKQGFNITLERSFDSAAGEADVFPQDITRVLLNLISNGFYAATKRKAEANGGDYEPTVTAATKNLGDRVEISIRDNGTGVPPDVKEKMFNPFFTTKPAGEGTGLGLSISHDIVVKEHGGSIEVDTQPGEFTEFRIVLPRTGASLIKSGEQP